MTAVDTTPVSEASRHARGRRTERLLALVLAGLVLDLVLIYGFLWPLNHADHPDVLQGLQGLADVFGPDRSGQSRFIAGVVAAFLAYVVAAVLARGVAGRKACWVVLAGTTVFAVTLLPTNPAGSQDVYHYIADARTLWVHGDNPAVTPPTAHPEDPIVAHVPFWTDTPSPYGPLWFALSGAPLPFAGDDLWRNVLGQKVLAAALLLTSTALVMLTAARIRPGSAAVAGVLIGWNPLLLFETAVNAHNDIAMITFVLAAFYASVRRWWLLVFPLLALAVAVKYVVIVLAPVVLIWMLMRRDASRRDVALSAGAGAAVGAAVYAPFIADGAIFETLRDAGVTYISSVGSVLVSQLMYQRGMAPGDAALMMRRILTAVFITGYLVLLLRMWRRPSYTVLAGTSAAVMFLFLVTMKWWFWPWYLTWLVPIAALAPHRRIAILAVLFSFTGMLHHAAYTWNVYDDWHDQQELMFWTVFATPLAVAGILVVQPLVFRVLTRMKASRAVVPAEP
jgi:alpha-1,6-mannosyltransferase